MICATFSKCGWWQDGQRAGVGSEDDGVAWSMHLVSTVLRFLGVLERQLGGSGCTCVMRWEVKGNPPICRHWQGRRGAAAALVSSGTHAPLSRRNDHFPPGGCEVAQLPAHLPQCSEPPLFTKGGGGTEKEIRANLFFRIPPSPSSGGTPRKAGRGYQEFSFYPPPPLPLHPRSNGWAPNPPIPNWRIPPFRPGGNRRQT